MFHSDFYCSAFYRLKKLQRPLELTRTLNDHHKKSRVSDGYVARTLPQTAHGVASSPRGLCHSRGEAA